MFTHVRPFPVTDGTLGSVLSPRLLTTDNKSNELEDGEIDAVVAELIVPTEYEAVRLLIDTAIFIPFLFPQT